MKFGEVLHQTNILSIVQNGLLLSFDKDQPSKASFECPRTKAETELLETEVEKFLKKGVIAQTKIQPDDYFSNLFKITKEEGIIYTCAVLDCIRKHMPIGAIDAVKTHKETQIKLSCMWHVWKKNPEINELLENVTIPQECARECMYF